MARGVFGLDFGTTNCLATFIEETPGSGAEKAIVLRHGDARPHPSVVWYSAEGPVVGRKARDQMGELVLGVSGDIVRSPKMFLGSPAPIPVAGRRMAPSDVVADILKFLRNDALARGGATTGHRFDRAVVTIPVSMEGPGRRDLREAAHKAGMRIHQFVHEPLAALYGYLRGRPDFEQEVFRLESLLVLVFDWGGGTLDLTLCQVLKGALVQVVNVGNPNVGGDKFDLRIRDLVRERHLEKHPTADWGRLQPTADARLLTACEDAKIALSERAKTTVYVKDVLAVEGAAAHVSVVVTTEDLASIFEDLLRQGLGSIEKVMEQAGLPMNALEYCLATGGMVSMPAVRQGLIERLGAARLRTVDNADSIISEGAAWIAHDDLAVTLAKPFEVLHAGNSYLPVLRERISLPSEGQQISQRVSMYCVDPTDGIAKFEFARPHWPGQNSVSEPRVPYLMLTVPVDPNARPLIDRLHLEVTVDHDLVAWLRVGSLQLGEWEHGEVTDLEFGLALPGNGREPKAPEEEPKKAAGRPEMYLGRRYSTKHKGTVQARSNIFHEKARSLIPGGIVKCCGSRGHDQAASSFGSGL